jgi:hypothetical protein
VRFARSKQLRYDFLLNGADVFRSYGLKSVPAVLYLDANGVVADAELGFTEPAPLMEKAEALMRRHRAPAQSDSG